MTVTQGRSAQDVLLASDLYQHTEGHGFDAGCECDLVGGDPDCTIQPPYESSEAYINRLQQRVIKAEFDQSVLCDLLAGILSTYILSDPKPFREAITRAATVLKEKTQVRHDSH